MKAQRDDAIVVLRWLAILAVIVQHAAFTSRYNESSIDAILVLRELGGWCVLSFFSISGYLTKRTVFNGKFVISRAKRLLIPYVAVSIVSFFGVLVINRAGLYHTENSEVLSFSSLALSITSLSGFGPQLYFLPYLFLISVFVLFVSGKIPELALLSILFGIVLIQLVFKLPVTTTGGHWENLGLYALAYTLGFKFSASEFRQSKTANWLLGIITVIGIGNSVYGINLISHLIFGFWVYAAFERFQLFKRAADFLDHLNVGAVYLWHTPILLPAATIFLQRLHIGELPNFAGAIAISVLGSLTIHRLLTLFRIERYLSL